MDEKINVFGSGNVKVLLLVTAEKSSLIDMLSLLNKNNLEITILSNYSTDKIKSHINTQKVPYTCVLECEEKSSKVEGFGFTFRNLLTKVPSLSTNTEETETEMQQWYREYYELPYIRIGVQTDNFITKVKDLLTYLNGV